MPLLGEQRKTFARIEFSTVDRKPTSDTMSQIGRHFASFLRADDQRDACRAVRRFSPSSIFESAQIVPPRYRNEAGMHINTPPSA